MRYEFFTVSDFLGDPQFRKWVLENDRNSEIFWNGWLQKHPEKLEEVNEAKALLYALRERMQLPDDKEIEKQVAVTLTRLHSQHPATIGSSPLVRKFYYGVSAASLFALLALGWFYIDRNDIPAVSDLLAAEAENNRVVVRSTKTTSRSVLLEDGSRIVLAPDSELSYPGSFDSLSREVYLKGEAFFEIARDTKRPFRVVAPDLVAEVLGTSFTVSSFESSPEASVSVKTGKVSVITSTRKEEKKEPVSGEKNGMILNPNQEAIYNRTEAKLVKKLAPNPEIVITIPPSSLVFDAAPVVEVLNTISEQYGISIVYNEEILINCLMTGDLTDNSLYEQLELICRLAHARYDIVEGQIIIHSSGCPAAL